MTGALLIDFTPITDGFYLEGLLIDGDAIWYTDVAIGGVQRVGSTDILLAGRNMIGGLYFNADGKILVSGAGGIEWVQPETGASGALITGLDGVNEMRADDNGGLYFGTIDLPAIVRGERPGPSSIEYLSISRQQRTLRKGLSFANGLAVSLDGHSLYFNESFSSTQAFPIEADGVLGEPATLIDLYDCDGMALDIDGNIWVTGFASSDLRCVKPNGTEVCRVALPGAACTNVRFGGSDNCDLYVTMVDPTSAQALAEGRPLTERNSKLFRGRSPVAGAPVLPSRFTLS